MDGFFELLQSKTLPEKVRSRFFFADEEIGNWRLKTLVHIKYSVMFEIQDLGIRA